VTLLLLVIITVVLYRRRYFFGILCIGDFLYVKLSLPPCRTKMVCDGCQTDDDTGLTSEQRDEGETSLPLHSAPLHAEPSASSTSCEEFKLEAPGCDGAAAVTAADVGQVEMIAGSEHIPDQGVSVCLMVEYVVITIIVEASYTHTTTWFLFNRPIFPELFQFKPAQKVNFWELLWQTDLQYWWLQELRLKHIL